MKNKIIFIAEAGVNHNGSLKKALRLVDIAADCGADYIKFQVVNADLITKSAKKANYQKNNTKDKDESQYEMIKKLELNWDIAHKEIIKRCKKKKIKFLTSAFSVEDLNVVKKLNVEMFKIPSGEITNLPLLEHVSKFKKKVLLSTGMATLKEISDAIQTLYKSGLSKKNLILMQCNSAYPSPLKDLNLKVLENFKKKYDVQIGFSDHSEGILAPIVAAGLGAKYIEKHFTISKKLRGPDHICSLSPKEMKQLVNDLRQTEVILGNSSKKITHSESKNRKLVRKSIYAKKDIQKGEIFSEKNIALKRPGYGLHPNKFKKLLGKKSTQIYRVDQPIKN